MDIYDAHYEMKKALRECEWLLNRATPIRRGNGARAEKAVEAWNNHLAKLEAILKPLRDGGVLK